MTTAILCVSCLLIGFWLRGRYVLRPASLDEADATEAIADAVAAAESHASAKVVSPLRRQRAADLTRDLEDTPDATRQA